MKKLGRSVCGGSGAQLVACCALREMPTQVMVQDGERQMAGIQGRPKAHSYAIL